jgi:stage V sporulation protein R
LELFRYIEERWNRGRFGIEYELCDDANKRKVWDTNAGKGREKIFEVRRVYNDITFIDEFLDQEFCDAQKLFTYGIDRETGQYVILDRDHRKVKQRLLFSLANWGHPHIYVLDGNYRNRGELYLIHRFEGVGLDIKYARPTLENLQKIWTRPVHIETFVDEKPAIMTYDGEKHETTQIDKDSQGEFDFQR